MGYDVWGQYTDYIDYWFSKIDGSLDSNWKEEMALLKPRQEGPGVTRESFSCPGKSQRSVVRVGVSESKEDTRTLGVSPTRVNDCEGGVGDASLLGVVRGVGVTRKLILMLQMTVTVHALMVRRRSLMEVKRLETAVVDHMSTMWRLVTCKINNDVDMSPVGLLLLVSRDSLPKEVNCDPRMGLVMLRPSTRRSRYQISVSRAFG